MLKEQKRIEYIPETEGIKDKMTISWIPQDPVKLCTLSCRSVISHMSRNSQVFSKINRANNMTKHYNNRPLWTCTVCAKCHNMIQGVSEQPTGPSLPKLQKWCQSSPSPTVKHETKILLLSGKDPNPEDKHLLELRRRIL